MRCLVYPRPGGLAAAPAAVGRAASGGTARNGRGSEDFSGLRTHQPADSPRHVAWKAVAREQPLLTKQFTGASAGPGLARLERIAAGLDIEARLSRLTRWLLDAHAQGLAYGLRLPGGRSRSARARGSFRIALRHWPCMATKRDSRPSPAARSSGCSPAPC
jgi:uncharacterized protein (DUF58 family)